LVFVLGLRVVPRGAVSMAGKRVGVRFVRVIKKTHHKHVTAAIHIIHTIGQHRVLARGSVSERAAECRRCRRMRRREYLPWRPVLAWVWGVRHVLSDAQGGAMANRREL